MNNIKSFWGVFNPSRSPCWFILSSKNWLKLLNCSWGFHHFNGDIVYGCSFMSNQNYLSYAHLTYFKNLWIETRLHQVSFEFAVPFDRSANAYACFCFVFMVTRNRLNCQKVCQTQMMPDLVKFLSKGFEIKLKVKYRCKN